MTGRLWLTGLLLATSVSAAAEAQTTRDGPQRWNDRAFALDTLETPAVSLWLEGSRTYSYGEPVRVWFNVSDDAYVVVARVDANGHLTVLFPSSRSQRAEVEAGRDIPVRGRRGAASFYATDRVGGGFVFAISSYDPFNLSPLGMRDFDRYVTGTYVGRPSQVYIGDPHRIVSRFASIIAFTEQSPFDYAVDFYNVDAPYYVTSAGYSNFCNGYSGNYRRGLAERWDDEFFYGSGGGSAFGCESVSPCAVLGFGGFGYSSGFGGLGYVPSYCYPQGYGNNGGNLPPTNIPGADSLRVRPWLADSIGGSRPDTVGTIPDARASELQDGLNSLRRGTTGTERTRRPDVIADADPAERSYAIPGRALRNSRTTIGQSRDPQGGATLGGPDRRTPSATGGPGIDWVRPPREVVEGPRNLGEGVLPRSPRQRGERLDRGERNGDPVREGRPTFVNPSNGRRDDVRAQPPRFDPPTRTQGPRFDAPSPNVRTNNDGPRFYQPPPRTDSPRNDSPRFYSPGANGSGTQIERGGGDAGPDRSAQVRADPPRPSSPPPSPAPPASSGEKKPERPSP